MILDNGDRLTVVTAASPTTDLQYLCSYARLSLTTGLGPMGSTAGEFGSSRVNVLASNREGYSTLVRNLRIANKDSAPAEITLQVDKFDGSPSYSETYTLASGDTFVMDSTGQIAVYNANGVVS